MSPGRDGSMEVASIPRCGRVSLAIPQDCGPKSPGRRFPPRSRCEESSSIAARAERGQINGLSGPHFDRSGGVPARFQEREHIVLMFSALTVDLHDNNWFVLEQGLARTSQDAELGTFDVDLDQTRPQSFCFDVGVQCNSRYTDRSTLSPYAVTDDRRRPGKPLACLENQRQFSFGLTHSCLHHLDVFKMIQPHILPKHLEGVRHRFKCHHLPGRTNNLRHQHRQITDVPAYIHARIFGTEIFADRGNHSRLVRTHRIARVDTPVQAHAKTLPGWTCGGLDDFAPLKVEQHPQDVALKVAEFPVLYGLGLVGQAADEQIPEISASAIRLSHFESLVAGPVPRNPEGVSLPIHTEDSAAPGTRPQCSSSVWCR